MKPEHIFIIAGCFVAPLILLGLHSRGRRELSIFPDFQSVKIKFQETWATGRAITGNYFIRAGVNGVLRVYITEDELWIRTSSLHAATARQSGMIHRIKLSQIETLELGKGGQLSIEYKTPGGVDIKFWINLRNRNQFLEAIGSEKLRTAYYLK